MKRIFTVLVAAFIATTAMAIAQPKMELLGIKNNTYDWGTVSPKESPLTADIKIKNTGDAELIIAKVKPSCGCTTAPLEKDRLMPGEETMMNVSLKVATSTGQVQKSITITSNDAGSPTTVLYIKANVDRPISVTPRYLYFNDMEAGTEAVATVKIRNSSNQDVTLSDIKADNGVKLDIGSKVVVKAGETIEVAAKVVPAKDGYFSASVSMKTSHPEYETLEIKGYGNVKEPTKSKAFVD